MHTNNTAEKYGIALHPHHKGEFILTETATGGVLKTGTRDEMIAFCKEKLAASVSIVAMRRYEQPDRYLQSFENAVQRVLSLDKSDVPYEDDDEDSDMEVEV